MEIIVYDAVGNYFLIFLFSLVPQFSNKKALSHAYVVFIELFNADYVHSLSIIFDSRKFHAIKKCVLLLTLCTFSISQTIILIELNQIENTEEYHTRAPAGCTRENTLHFITLRCNVMKCNVM